MFVPTLSLAVDVRAAETIQLSYGTFTVHYSAPLEMEHAVEYCSNLTGRLPRFNNYDDFDALDALHLAHNTSVTWVRAESFEFLASGLFRLRLLTDQLAATWMVPENGTTTTTKIQSLFSTGDTTL